MVVLGSSGSIGQNALQIAKKFGIEIEALAVNKNYEILNAQIAEFAPKMVYIGDESLREKVNCKWVFSGADGIEKMLENCESRRVVNALVGFAGLKPSVATQKLGKTLCLANKESLVVAGKFLKTDKIHPIDSEHFGLKFLLKDRPPIKNLVITASGGAFRDLNIQEIATATPQMALKHPNWAMGAKITIDSASMANKLFEVLEAFWLYKTDKIDALIEKSSVIHALVEFIDGSTTAHISKTDMKLAIASAILDEIKEPILGNFNLLEIKNLEFEEINLEKYPIFSLKNDVLKNPNLGVIINAANEIFVKKFLNNECGFLDGKRLIFQSLSHFGEPQISELNDVFEIDKKVREYCQKI